MREEPHIRAPTRLVTLLSPSNSLSRMLKPDVGLRRPRQPVRTPSIASPVPLTYNAMFAPEGRQTPRPRPPAQIRRSTSKGLSPDSAPPPPYALEFPSLLECNESDMSDPVTATAKMMGIQLNAEPEVSSVTEEEVSQKSREELTNLFLQAEKIIRARETELNVAANLGKTLLETNEALKLRHDALLSRLPAMQSPASALPSPTTKPTHPDAWTTDDDMPSTLSRIRSRTNSIISSVRESPAHSRTSSLVGTTSSPRRGHGRRISASPSALIALSETNAELIAELTRLRSSTDSDQIEGARRLRKLEREIGGLKAELESSQRVNAELEEKVRAQVDEEHRREREQRVRKLRAGDEAHEPESDHEVRDFAPQGHGVETWDSIGTPRMARQDSVSSETSRDSDLQESHSDADISSGASTRPPSQHNTAVGGEFAVVSQLYRKVEELRDANADLSARNRITSEQLARAEREALQIKRLYEEIGQEFGDADAEQSESEDVETGTIRASSSSSISPRRSLRSPLSLRALKMTPKATSWSFRGGAFDAAEDPFADDTPRNKVMRTATGSRRALGNKSMCRGFRTLKSRKPLTDALFAPPADAEDGGLTPSIVLVPSRTSHTKPKSKGKVRPKAKSAPFRAPSPFNSLALQREFSDSSRLSGTGMTLSASTSSFLTASMSSLTHHVGRGGRRSLGSELGDEFGDDWGVGDVPRHDNLFDEESLKLGSELYIDHEEGEEGEEEKEDPALAALRQAFTPPYAGRLLEQDEHILPVGALQASPGEAFQLVAHAVTVRPNRWLESDNKRLRITRGPGPRGVLANSTTFFTSRAYEDPWETTRYPDIDPSEDEDENRDERGSVRMHRRDRALGRMVSTAHARHVSGDTFELVPSASQLQTADYYPRRSRHKALVESIRRTSGNALIELWIFLQFVVVICTFLYTMSRRGHREVMGVPPRRA